MTFVTFLTLVATVGLVIMACGIIASVHLIRKERNTTTTCLKYCSLFFGVALLLDCIFFLPLYLMTGFGVAWIYAGPALTYLMLWIFLGYPGFYILGQIGAHIAYRKGKMGLSRAFMFLPLLSLVPLAICWILIGVHQLIH